MLREFERFRSSAARCFLLVSVFNEVRRSLQPVPVSVVDFGRAAEICWSLGVKLFSVTATASRSDASG